MSSTTTRLLLILISVAVLSATSTTADSPSVYEVLQSYDFPIGLLPKGVTSYELDTSTGEFSVYLNDSCSFSINGYDLKYKSTITGTISTDKITNLKGIQVKVLFFWVNIIEVTKEDDEIEFSVGIASASFALDEFYECPQCGCGFDCVNSVTGNRSRKPSLIERVVALVQYN